MIQNICIIFIVKVHSMLYNDGKLKLIEEKGKWALDDMKVCYII